MTEQDEQQKQQAADRAVINRHLMNAGKVDFKAFIIDASGVPQDKQQRVSVSGDTITLPAHDPVSGQKANDFRPLLIPHSFGIEAQQAPGGRIEFDAGAVMEFARPVLEAKTPEGKEAALRVMWENIDQAKAAGKPFAENGKRSFSDYIPGNGEQVRHVAWRK